MAAVSKSGRQEAIARLREWVKPGDTLYTNLKHVSRSGMQRTIQIIKIENNEPTYIGWTAAEALGWSYDGRREGVKVAGCGMDMGFHLVYELSATLFPGGYIPADAGEKYGRNGADASARDPDGGYALKHRWL